MAATVVIGAVVAAGTTAWHWFSLPSGSDIHAVYQGISQAPVILMTASNKGKRSGSITQAEVLVQWNRADKLHEFGFGLRIGTPLPVPPESNDISFEIPIWIPARLYLQETTNTEDIAALLQPTKAHDYSTAPIAGAHCQVQYEVVNSDGKHEDKFAGVETCLDFATLIILPQSK